ncbi:TRAP transporter substrate-binding protein [Desulfofundulus thermosubterraneus]|uniref:TRAP-type C4-dicarboxylate transport system, substrate-binding protein n=1 Tax=Desulfofundulus thermosubterraneus DSM 16057 TaxID=1121432 RepID=A0A1M6M8G2_9FIRM|nr:TRAP transporter substrate-binding protein DctP [Desulfofundulus thermosubterraneus]SHJ79748.1 TRAP-type C4-dicarboxylate transport system, substrate-binding protein [Desulfofundulus thermosubterraneus DSM 16057]
MKKLAYLLCVTVLSLALAGCGGQKTAKGTGEQQSTYTLKMSDYYPVTHIASRDLAKFFIDQVEKQTSGRVKIEYYPAEQLGKLKDQLNLASQGVVDIAIAPASFLAGQLPLNTVMILPEWTKASEGSAIYDKLARGVLMEEFQKYGVRPIFMYTFPQYNVGTVKKPINSPEDLKGLKLKTSGGLFDKIAARYGVTPVVVPSPEIYESTQRGVVEGNILNIISAKSYKVDELEKYHTFGLALGGYPVAYVINENSWKKMPEDIQKAILQAGEEASKHAGQVFDQEEQKYIKDFEQKGIKIHYITAEEKAKWLAPLKGIEQEWIDEMEKKGLPGKKVYEEFHKLCQEIVK